MILSSPESFMNSMQNKITHAFILAAGFGKRMMPLTKNQPKPMVGVLGQPMIGHILDHLKIAGVTHVTVNGHYKAEILREYLKTRDDLAITFSYEKDILETGGGLVHGLHTMPTDAPFFIINGDAFWINSDQGTTLDQLSHDWDADKMDLLTLLQDKDKMALGTGVGDYDILENGQVKRNLNQQGKYMFAGVRIAHPRIFKDAPSGRWNFLDLMDKTQELGTHFGHIHQGAWHHLSTPDDIKRLEKHYDQIPLSATR